MTEAKYYLDRQGYLCFKNSDKPLHRYIAKKEIWEKNRKKYPLEFWEYQVHHKDKDKLNNTPENLELLSRLEHEIRHGLERREWDIIRLLIVVIFMISILQIWGNLVRINNLSDNLFLGGFLIILILGFLTITFLNRYKKNKRKII